MEDNRNEFITPSLHPLAIPIDEPVLDPANARTGHDIQGIADSIKMYQQRTPIVVNRSQNNKVEKGNGTLQAMRSIGATHIAAVLVEDDPMTATGYAIADNRLGDKSQFDYDILMQSLEAHDSAESIPGVDPEFLEHLTAYFLASQVEYPGGDDAPIDDDNDLSDIGELPSETILVTMYDMDKVKDLMVAIRDAVQANDWKATVQIE